MANSATVVPVELLGLRMSDVVVGGGGDDDDEVEDGLGGCLLTSC